MFEEIPFMLGFIIFSLAAQITIRYLPRPIDLILIAFSIVGIICHELCHWLMCIITRTPVEHVSLIKKLPNKNPEKYKFGGEVKLREEARMSFLKAFLIGFAPAYITFWIFWFLWGQIRNTGLEDLIIIFYILLMCSLFLGAAPSLEDLKSIKYAFTRDVYHSLYQLALIAISILTVWSILYISGFQVIHEIINYLFFATMYAIYRYSFMGLDHIWQKMRSSERPFTNKGVRVRKLTRKTYKPMKAKKLGIEEPHW